MLIPNRKRSEQLLAEGQDCMFLANPNWLISPADFVAEFRFCASLILYIALI